MLSEGLLAAFGVAAFALDVFAIVRAISRDHGVERTLAWIFAILALPVLGALVYLALASPNVKRIRQRKLERSLAVRGPLLGLDPDALAPASGPLFALAVRLTGIEPTPGNTVRFLVENEGAFQRIEQAIQDAKREVLAEYYLVRNDATGHRFLDLLTAKAAERQSLFDLEDSHELTLDEVLARGRLPRLVDSTARLLSPLLQGRGLQLSAGRGRARWITRACSGARSP